MKLTRMDRNTKEKLVFHVMELRNLVENIYDLFHKHRNGLVQETIPMHDEAFNSVEKFVENFMPMILSSINLPRPLNFKSPLSEKNFSTESLRFLSDLEQAAYHLRQIESGLEYYTRGRADIIGNLERIVVSCKQTKTILLQRASDLNISAEAYALSVGEVPPDGYFEQNAYYLAVLYHAKVQTQNMHNTCQRL
ncbi:uncharacterized protein LOC135493309 [Lineus longissimus]|uniref:uncharacterized protein LOC135493309 n=1 Tax=Lineus longissimus TaxID=88925 RepID=UPI002B4F9E5C